MLYKAIVPHVKHHNMNMGMEYRSRMCPFKEILVTIMSCLVAISVAESINTESSMADCVGNCHGVPNGFYASCDSPQAFVSCSDEIVTVMNCPSGMEWDNSKRTCKSVSMPVYFQHSYNGSSMGKATQNKSGNQGPLFSIHHENSFVKPLKVGVTQQTPPKESPQMTFQKAVESELKVLISDKQASGSRSSPVKAFKQLLATDVTNSKSENESNERNFGAYHLNMNNLRELKHLWKISHKPQSKEQKEPNEVIKVTKTPKSTAESQTMEDPEPSINAFENIPKNSNLSISVDKVSKNYYILPDNETNFAGDCLFRQNKVVTFDGVIVQLVGNCKYVAAQIENKTELSVEVQLRASPESSEETRTVVDFVDFTVNNRWVRLHSVGIAFADGIMVSPGRRVVNPDYTAITGPDFSLLQTANGVIGTLDRDHRFILYLPPNYSDRVMGLCRTIARVNPSAWKTLDQQSQLCIHNSTGNSALEDTVWN